ncbi:unnamed protein product [Rhodiola kirilowii]
MATETETIRGDGGGLTETIGGDGGGLTETIGGDGGSETEATERLRFRVHRSQNMEEKQQRSIYRLARSIKRKDNSVYNALHSIYEDSIFVGEISQLWAQLPVMANLRCGLWYSSNFHSTCYFKSTDGHNNNWSFNTSRLNLHVALLAAQKGGCIIVDSTRKGKRFPDSMSKTIPIWACVLNKSVHSHLNKMQAKSSAKQEVDKVSIDWDCSLHLPLWVSRTERASIEDRLEEWTNMLEASGADIESLALSLKKPLRPLWVSQSTVIWLNEVPKHNSWDFTPVILINASSSVANIQHRTTSEHSWNYIPGAGDDEESWARGLTPGLFWKHAYDLINSGPDVCNQKVAEIVERDRVHRALRGQNAPQIFVKPSKVLGTTSDILEESTSLHLNTKDTHINEDRTVSWIRDTNIAVGAARYANVADAECTLNCGLQSISNCQGIYIHLPIMNSKMDRFSLLNNLPCALQFAKSNLNKSIWLVGEDISVCVCLAILISLYDDQGNFDGGDFFHRVNMTKLELRKHLVMAKKGKSL